MEAEITDLEDISQRLESSGPEEILRWTCAEFKRDVALATGFGVEGCVLVHMLASIDRSARMFYLDTDMLFPETYALRDKLESTYGVRFEQRSTKLTVRQQALTYGEELWKWNPDECCRLRKVEPLREMLFGLSAWITGIRREQSSTRASVQVIERDSHFGLVKVNPLAAWTRRDVWDYVERNKVPYNPLLDQGYESIGCTPCTTPIQIGEDPRAGRWRGKSKTECGIHLNPGK